MKNIKYLVLFGLGLLVSSCGSNSDDENRGFSINFSSTERNFQLDDTIFASIGNQNERQIDSIVYFFQNEKINATLPAATTPIVLENKRLGNHQLQAQVFSEGEKIEVSENVKIYSDQKPVTYTYNIIATYPHDPRAYTQGLEFHDDVLYESTGQHGRSSLRKVDFRTGEVLAQLDLPNDVFGEGLTILGNKIYQLTWQNGEGYIYDIENFERTGSFSYNQSKEGWGLANDGRQFYKSDGTEKIWILNGETLAEEDFIQVATHSTIVSRMNELEWIDGRIYANTYQKDGVAIINPQNGAIEGLIDFRGLRDQLGNVDDLDPLNDVLNGIAYNPNTKKLYVTGKDWDKLFEVEIVEK